MNELLLLGGVLLFFALALLVVLFIAWNNHQDIKAIQEVHKTLGEKKDGSG